MDADSVLTFISGIFCGFCSGTITTFCLLAAFGLGIFGKKKNMLTSTMRKASQPKRKWPRPPVTPTHHMN